MILVYNLQAKRVFTLRPLNAHLSAGEAAAAPSVSYFPSCSSLSFRGSFTFYPAGDSKSATNPEYLKKNGPQPPLGIVRPLFS